MPLLLALLLLISHDAATQPVRQLPASATPASIVEIPLRISLDRLFEVAEQEIHVEARLGGDFAGDVELRAEMRFVPKTQQLQVQNLSYEYTPDDPWLQAEADLLYGYIRKLLEAAANRHLQRYMEQGRQRLHALFKEIAPDGAKADMTTFELRQVQLDLVENAIRLHGLASGHIELEYR